MSSEPLEPTGRPAESTRAAALALAEEVQTKQAKTRSRSFDWQSTDVESGEPISVHLEIPRKFKRFKFNRRFAAGDMIGALDIVFGEAQIRDSGFEDLDLTDEQFEDLMEKLGNALGGTSTGN